MFLLLAHAGGSEWFPTELTPLHPILVNFTAALLPTSLVADLLGRWMRKPSLSGTAWWTLLLGAVVTPLTAAAGWYWKREMDMPGMDGARMAIHQWLGISLAVLFAVVMLWRGQTFKRDRVPGYGYLSMLTVLVGLLTLQGHLGGMMSFGERESSETRSAHTESEATRPPMTMPMPATASAGADADGWSDSIHMKRK